MRAALLAIVLTAAIAAAQSTLPPEVLLLSKIKRQARRDLERIPNFTCLETIERSSRQSSSRPFVTQDTVQVEVAHTGDHEMFAWPGGHFETADLGAMIGSGLTSNGEFLAHARSVFISDFGVVHYAGRVTIGRVQAAQYDYDVSPSFSGYTVHNAGHEGVVAVKGSFWADPETLDLLRLTAGGADIPPDLGVSAVSTEVDYSRVRIGGDFYLLPQSATVDLQQTAGHEERNRIEFTHCRQYATESVLSFADPEIEATKQPDPPRRLPEEVAFPADLSVTTILEKPVNLESSRIGQEIVARLASDVSRKGHVYAPKGSAITGRLRLLKREKTGYTIGLELTYITLPSGHVNFLAKLISVDSRFSLPSSAVETTRTGGFQLDLPIALPGVATFFIPDSVKELPSGMTMQWRTVTPRR